MLLQEICSLAATLTTQRMREYVESIEDLKEARNRSNASRDSIALEFWLVMAWTTEGWVGEVQTYVLNPFLTKPMIRRMLAKMGHDAIPVLAAIADKGNFGLQSLVNQAILEVKFDGADERAVDECMRAVARCALQAGASSMEVKTIGALKKKIGARAAVLLAQEAEKTGGMRTEECLCAALAEFGEQGLRHIIQAAARRELQYTTQLAKAIARSQHRIRSNGVRQTPETTRPASLVGLRVPARAHP